MPLLPSFPAGEFNINRGMMKSTKLQTLKSFLLLKRTLDEGQANAISGIPLLQLKSAVQMQFEENSIAKILP